MTMRSVFILLCLFITAPAWSQKETSDKKREGAEQAEMNVKENDTSGEKDSNGNYSQRNAKAGQSDYSQNTPPATGEQTSSSSGSPAINYDKDNLPDGTNTVPRATLNIAGSSIPGGKTHAENNTVEKPERSNKKVEKKTNNKRS